MPSGIKEMLSNIYCFDGDTRCKVYIKKAVNCHFGDNYNNCHISHNHIRQSPTKKDELLLECVNHLKLQHSTRNAYMFSLLWYDESRDYSLENYFINLQIDEDDLMGKFKKRKNIELQELFTSVENKALNKRILITGKPGFGKTTLVKKLAYDWATLSHPHYLSNYDLVIVIELRKLGNRTITETLSEVFLDKPEELVSALEATQLDILLLLDGYDELSETHKVLEFIKAETKSCRYSAKMTILLTSRPHSVESLRMEFQRRLTIIGFSKENQLKYVYLALGGFATSSHKFASRVQNDRFLSHLSVCPLMLHLLCCLHQDIDLLHVRRVTDIYVEIFSLIIRRYAQKYNDNRLLKKGKYLPGETLLAKFGAIAFLYLNKRINSINEHELKKVHSDEEYEIIKRLDFLVGTQVLSKNGRIEMEFEMLHRTFTEFLSSLHLAVNYELFESLERKKNIDIYGIRHYSKDIELALVDHETFLLCYFGLTRDRSALYRFLKFPVQLSAGRNVALLSHLKNEISVRLWKECVAIVKFLDFNCGEDSIIDLRSVLKESFLEEIILHITSHCSLLDIKDILKATEMCHSLKSIMIYPVTHVYMRLYDDLETVIFYVDLGLSMESIIQFSSLKSSTELIIRLAGEAHYIYDVTKKTSSYFDFQESNFIGLLVFDSGDNEKSKWSAFHEISSLIFELIVDKIVIRMKFRSCVYRFGIDYTVMKKKVVFFVTREQYNFLASHPTLCVLTVNSEIVSPTKVCRSKTGKSFKK